MELYRKYAPLLASVLIPLIPFLYLYSRNAQYLLYWHAVIVCMVCSAISVIAFFMIKLVFKSDALAMIFCLIAWAITYFGDFLYSKLSHFGVRYRHIVLMLLLIIFLLFSATALLSKKINLEPVVSFLGMVSIIMFIINASTAVYQTVALGEKAPEELPFANGSSFVVDTKLPSPNVYWFHCDGMLGFDAMERYFGDSQENLVNELNSRGFLINKGAQFEASHSTTYAVPSLMCPAFYDQSLEPFFEEYSHAREQKKPLPRMSYSEMIAARQNNELVNAFVNKNYHTSTIATGDIYFFPITERFYNITQTNTPLFFPERTNSKTEVKQSEVYAQTISMSRLLPKIITYNSFTVKLIESQYAKTKRYAIESQLDPEKILENTLSNTQTATLIRSLDDTMSMDEPRFVLINYMIAHWPFSYLENGDANTGNANDIFSYPAHHRYAAKVLVNMVDMVLEKDPDAVIVLQADHGLHGQTDKQIMAAFSTEESAVGIWNGVMSAVRIPSKYGFLEQPLEPLNITRYLVNNYVGENYEYLE